MLSVMHDPTSHWIHLHHPIYPIRMKTYTCLITPRLVCGVRARALNVNRTTLRPWFDTLLTHKCGLCQLTSYPCIGHVPHTCPLVNTYTRTHHITSHHTSTGPGSHTGILPHQPRALHTPVPCRCQHVLWRTDVDLCACAGPGRQGRPARDCRCLRSVLLLTGQYIPAVQVVRRPGDAQVPGQRVGRRQMAQHGST